MERGLNIEEVRGGDALCLGRDPLAVETSCGRRFYDTD